MSVLHYYCKIVIPVKLSQFDNTSSEAKTVKSVDLSVSTVIYELTRPITLIFLISMNLL